MAEAWMKYLKTDDRERKEQTHMMNKGEKYEIEITDLGNNGEGIGRIDGMAVFVPGALPGDRIMAEITETKELCERKAD